MKPIHALYVLPLFLVPAAPAARASTVQSAQEDFISKFKAALKVGATDEMNRLVRTHQVPATDRILELGEILVGGTREELLAEQEALAKAWHTVYKTSYPEKVSEFFTGFTPEAKEERDKLIQQYRNEINKFRDAEKAGDQEQMAAIGASMKTVGEGFSTVGDQYYASQAFLLHGRANDVELRKDQADIKVALEGYQKAAEAREKFDLKDVVYTQTKSRIADLEHAIASGAPANGGGMGAGGAPGAPGAADPLAATGTLLTTTFEVVPDIELYRRPIYAGDSIFAMWGNVTLLAKGTTTKFPAVADSPSIARTGSAKVVIDADLDGTPGSAGDVEIPLTGKLTPVQITLGKGTTQRPWAFMSAVGGDRANYNGIQYNLSPSDEYISIYIAPAASLLTSINGTAVRILDDNMDGAYGSEPKTYGPPGLAEDFFQPEIDSVVVGESKIAVPWSEYLEVAGAWYRVSSNLAGNEIRYEPAPDLKTGTLKLDLKGVPVDWLLVKGEEKSDYAKCFYDLTAVKEGVQVPAGTYVLYAGQVSTGKKDQKAKALVLPSKATPTWTVAAGETKAVELGEPFGFDFVTHEDDAKLTVVGPSVVVTGKAKETYQRLWNCVVRPEVLTREAGKKRGAKADSMKGAETQEEVGEKGFQYAWFPYDFELEKKVPGELEVQLFEKKNKLFGKIESDWK
jgi:hypothetical protein